MIEESTAVVLARMEGKLDLLHAELRMTNVRSDDHESRIRALESRPVGLTPRVVLSTLAGAATILSASVAVIAFLVRAH